MKTRNLFLLLFLISSIVGILSIAFIYKNPSYYYRAKSKIIRIIRSNDILPEEVIRSTPPRTSYSKHVDAGKKYGVLLNTNQEIRDRTDQGKLVKVKNNTGYKVQRLTHSKAVLVPPALQVLKDIGQKFHSNTQGKHFTVTSLTRTVDSQKKLTRTNANATKNTSSHSYGVSFDISYIRFNGVKRGNPALKAQLEKILIDLQKKKKIYFIHEVNSKCYHVTVR